MKSQKKDVYYGIALNQIVEHPSFKALNKASRKQGRYILNPSLKDHVRVLVKYDAERNGNNWDFIFQDNDTPLVNQDSSLGSTYVVLVCGEESVCVLSSQELGQILDISDTKPQRVGVSWGNGQSMHVVWPWKNQLQKTVPHNRFPDILFS